VGWGLIPGVFRRYFSERREKPHCPSKFEEKRIQFLEENHQSLKKIHFVEKKWQNFLKLALFTESKNLHLAGWREGRGVGF